MFLFVASYHSGGEAGFRKRELLEIVPAEGREEQQNIKRKGVSAVWGGALLNKFITAFIF